MLKQVTWQMLSLTVQMQSCYLVKQLLEITQLKLFKQWHVSLFVLKKH
ncbi:Uncharacterised protein [Mycobacteroides abscessus subsp. abscessus]|nr:Uncharacterised protein [Mycobacteroides abscessus subsp. abscessus]